MWIENFKPIKMKKILFLFVCAISATTIAAITATTATAQGDIDAAGIRALQTKTLEECVQYAADHNIQLKQANLSLRQADLQAWSARSAVLPTASGTFQPAVNFGRSVDPTTNTFASQTIFSNQYSVSAGATLYAGGTIKNSIIQSSVDVLAAKADQANSLNTLALNVATVYLQVLLTEENLKITNERLAQTTRQLSNINKLIASGSLPAGNKLDVEAQQARDEQSIVQAENAIALAYLNLKTLMNYPPNEPLKVVQPDINIPTENIDNITVEGLYKTALDKQPQVQAAELRRKSAEIAVAVAKGRSLPTVQAFGSLRTNYSSLAKQVKDFGTQNTYFGDVNFGGTTFPLVVTQPRPNLENTPYFKQIDENFSQAVGVSVNVPIYQANQTRIGVERAKLLVENTDLQAEQVRRQLNNDIATALTNAKAAQRTYLAAEKTEKALSLAFANAEKRFAAGMSNSFELTTTRSNLDAAKVNVLTAKYDYLFRVKVLDFYKGIAIKL